MKNNSLLKKIANNIVDATITVTSATAGAAVGTYIVNHDMLNDQDMSMVAGVTAGAVTYVAARTTLMEVKNMVISQNQKNQCQPSHKMKKGMKNDTVK